MAGFLTGALTGVLTLAVFAFVPTSGFVVWILHRFTKGNIH